MSDTCVGQLLMRFMYRFPWEKIISQANEVALRR